MNAKDKEQPKPAMPRKKEVTDSRSKAKRDNVLGRRPSKSDPLGEQPGTVGHNAEAHEVIDDSHGHDLNPQDQVTNTDMDDRPVGGM